MYEVESLSAFKTQEECNSVVHKITTNTLNQAMIIHSNKIINSDSVVLYHGATNSNLIPTFGKGKLDCDYGQGFYLTDDKELAKEWSYAGFTAGNEHYVYSYSLNLKNLNILNLCKYDTLHWLAELYSYRKINYVTADQENDVKEFIRKYKLDTEDVDIIIGWRADDSYFNFASDFANNVLTKEKLDEALRLGNLGLQVFVKSEKAFSRLQYLNKEAVPTKYQAFRQQRDSKSKKLYFDIKKSKSRDKYYIRDFIGR